MSNISLFEALEVLFQNREALEQAPDLFANATPDLFANAPEAQDASEVLDLMTLDEICESLNNIANQLVGHGHYALAHVTTAISEAI